MFKLTKKKKLPKVENVEKNENIFVNSESTFPSAKDTLETSQKEWHLATAKEIISEIRERSSGGFRYAEFYHSTISEELINELTSKGYRVEVYDNPSQIVAPYFKIFW